MSIRLFRSFRLWSNLRPTFAATSKPTINAAGSRLAGTRLGARASLRCAEALLFVIGALCPMAAAQTAHFSGARSKIVDRSQFPGANRDADLADSGRNQVHREQTGSATDFGAVDVGTTSAAMTLTFTFDASATLGSTSVVTQGAPNLDFADAGTGTCKAGLPTANGDTCTVDVTFTPTLAGIRYGAAVLYRQLRKCDCNRLHAGHGLRSAGELPARHRNHDRQRLDIARRIGGGLAAATSIY